MFEYCGIKDIFIGVWKNKKSFLSIIMISVLVFCGVNYAKAQNTVKKSPIHPQVNMFLNLSWMKREKIQS